MFPLPLCVLQRWGTVARISVEGGLVFEVDHVQPVLALHVGLTLLTGLIQVEEVVEQQEIVSGVLQHNV